MTGNRTPFAVVALGLVLAFAALARAQTVDSLPSWNDGEAKQSIIAFVAQVTKALDLTATQLCGKVLIYPHR